MPECRSWGLKAQETEEKLEVGSWHYKPVAGSGRSGFVSWGPGMRWDEILEI